MQFQLISTEVLKECLTNILNRNYPEFVKNLKLEVSEKEFKEWKTKGINQNKLEELISKINTNKEEINKTKSIWESKEKEIIKTIKRLTSIEINTKEIVCYIDPYQNGGYYGEDNITVGAYENPEDILFVITHELFHVFYWRKLKDLNLTKSSMGQESLAEWKLAEALVHLLTTHKKMKRFWLTIAIDAYPEIEETLKKIEPLWKKSKFDDFLRRLHARRKE